MPPTLQEVVSDHRRHYLDRKLSRSPLLHFCPGAHRIDVFELFKGIQANLPVADRNTSGISEPTSLLKALLGGRFEASIHGVRASMLKKLDRMQTAANDSRHSTGQHTLYLGYPCLVMPVKDGKSKMAPIALFAISITVSSQKITIQRVLESSEGGLKSPVNGVLNRLLGAYVKKEVGISLAMEKHRFDECGREIDSLVQGIFAPWNGISREFNYPNATESISKEHLKNLHPEKDDPYIADHAIVGLAEFSGQALLDDLDKIEKAFIDGVECPPALAKLIAPAKSDTGNEAVEPGAESRKWLVDKSDPSQEKVVWAQQSNELVVLQGPPGTGKSQTIVNIVADALAHGKSVLVVCQKKAAIEVVQKRLNAAGLGDLTVLVDDIDKDRREIVGRIDSIDSEFGGDFLLDPERKRVAADIRRNEDRIDKVIEALNDKTDGNGVNNRLRFGDIKARLLRFDFLHESPLWPAKLKQSVSSFMAEGKHLSELASFMGQIARIDGDVRRYRYGRSTWSDVAVELEHDQETLNDLIGSTTSARKLASQFLDGGIPLHHDNETRWYVEHPWVQAGAENFSIAGLLTHEPDRDDFGKFHIWLKLLRQLEVANSRVSSHELSSTLQSNAFSLNFLAALEDDARELGPLLALKAEIKRDPILRVADESLSADRGNWMPTIYAMALHFWLKDLLQRQNVGMQDAPRVSDLVSQLTVSVKTKRMLDSKDILSKFQDRVDARNSLKLRNLLRLRGAHGIPKTSLRSLYQKGQSELRKVSPLLLVSPETASSMLPLVAGLYDIVVIDEASQMFVAEALPMLYRAKHALIAGDRQQMPPADFFAYGDAEEDEAEEDEAFETQGRELIAAEGVYRLLDAAEEALPAGSHCKLSLQVHYRSERKELIDFSNHAFYDGNLVIPAGNAPLIPFMQSAIEFELIEGKFQKGINEIEANRIVDILRNVWQTSTDACPSIGVIVANSRQRDRVNELLQSMCEADSAFRKAHDRETNRMFDGEDIGFFVRSVEHVQGDERDLIIFGLTYSGSSRSYGPLNKKDDGRKRLNVAVTRAKRGVIVLTSLNIGHISNEAEKGVQERYYVWQYLNYARAVSQHDQASIHNILNQLNAHRSIAEKVAAGTDSPFEDDVKAYAESLGFQVDCQVGESGFKIDLGVRHPGDGRNYLCGIECDGARYHSGWRARTNDVWRQEILESKGWVILRIWSTDWFHNPVMIKEKLAVALRDLKDKAAEKQTPTLHQFLRRFSGQAETAPSPVGKSSVEEPVVEIRIEGTTPAVLQDVQTVDVGDTVEFRYVARNELAAVKIVDGAGAPGNGTVNKDTPLAKALLDSAVGETVDFRSPIGVIGLEIRAIRRI